MTMSKKRSTRRDRRAPARRPIIVQRGAASSSNSALPAVDDAERVPEFESSLFGVLGDVPVEHLPLYTALTVVHNDMSGAPAGSCVSICHQLAGGLERLGFSAEVMTASATIFDRETRAVKYDDVGVWDRRPTVRPDGTTNGHVVLWAESFRRLVDPTIVQAPVLLKAARDDEAFTRPVVLRMKSREQLLAAGAVETYKGPFLISWTLFPEWTSSLAPALRGDLGAAMPYGTLGLAHAVLDLLRTLEQIRPDVRRLNNVYPKLGALLSGREHLPAMPAEPPAAFLRMRRAAGKTTP
jgi:hypothetical protein